MENFKKKNKKEVVNLVRLVVYRNDGKNEFEIKTIEIKEEDLEKLKKHPKKCELLESPNAIPYVYWSDQGHLIAPYGVVFTRYEDDPDIHKIFYNSIVADPQ